MTSALLILVGWVGVRAQEITYNLEPTHELGPELWSIPIGGKLTMSADGTRMLVASIADSAFFVVDVETGEYRKTSIRYYQDNTFGYTYYTVDAGIHILVECTTTSPDTVRSWDLDSDTLLAEAFQTDHFLAAVSGQHDRLIRGTTLLKVTTLEPVTTLPGAYRAWFDDDKRKVYLSGRNVVYEADALTGEIGREWVIRATSSEVRRPKYSDWLYVFAIESNTLDGQNWVEAINLVTGEHLKFSKYFWSLREGQPELLPFASEHAYSTANTSIVNGRDLGHSNVTWEFSAESRRSNTVLDLRFFYGTRESEKLRAIGPSKDLLCHTWWTRRKDSSITRCNALVPVTTSLDLEVGGDTTLDPVTTRVIDDHLEIASRDEEIVIQHIDVATIDGSVVLQHKFIDIALPIRIPIGHLANGTYVCSVQTSLGRFSSTFAIQR